MSDIIKINLLEVPDIIKNSDHYNSLINNIDSDEITENKYFVKIEKSKFFTNYFTNNYEDFINLLHTFQYWRVNNFHLQFFELVIKFRDYIIENNKLEEIKNSFQFLDINNENLYDKIVLIVNYYSKNNFVNIVAEYGYLDLFVFINNNLFYEINHLTCKIAVMNGHFHIIYFIIHNCENIDNTTNPLFDSSLLNSLIKFSIQYKKLQCFINLIAFGNKINFAIKNGPLKNYKDLNLIKVFYPLQLNINMFYYAIKYNSLEIVKYLIKQNFIIDNKCINIALQYDKLEILKYFYEINFNIFNIDIFLIAIEFCSIDTIIFIENIINEKINLVSELYNNIVYIHTIKYYVIQRDNFEIFKYFFDNKLNIDNHILLRIINKKNYDIINYIWNKENHNIFNNIIPIIFKHTFMLDFLHKNNFFNNKILIIKNIIYSNNTEIFDYFYEKKYFSVDDKLYEYCYNNYYKDFLIFKHIYNVTKYPFTENDLIKSIRLYVFEHESIQKFKFICENSNFIISNNSCEEILLTNIKSEYIKILINLKNIDFNKVISVDTLNKMILKNCIKNLSYLLLNNLLNIKNFIFEEIFQDICYNIVINKKDINILNLFYTIGCPIDERVIIHSITEGNIGVLRYIHEKGIDILKLEYSNLAAQKARVDIFKYLHLNKCEIDISTCISAAKYTNYSCLKYLSDNNFKFNEDVFDAVLSAEKSSLKSKCIKLLLSINCPYNTENESLLKKRKIDNIL